MENNYDEEAPRAFDEDCESVNNSQSQAKTIGSTLGSTNKH